VAGTAAATVILHNNSAVSINMKKLKICLIFLKEVIFLKCFGPLTLSAGSYFAKYVCGFPPPNISKKPLYFRKAAS